MGRGVTSVKAEFAHQQVDQQIKGFHLNVNQKGNKSIIVIWKKDCSLCLLCHIFDSYSQSGCFYCFSFWPRRYQCLKASVTTNYSWTLLDNALKSDSFEIHILINITMDGGRRVINQLWPNSSVPLNVNLCGIHQSALLHISITFSFNWVQQASRQEYLQCLCGHYLLAVQLNDVAASSGYFRY